MTMHTICVYCVFMKTVTQIFDDIGGPAKVSKMLGLKPSTATEMKRRQSIPVTYWPDLVVGCREAGVKGVTYDVLVSAHQKQEQIA